MCCFGFVCVVVDCVLCVVDCVLLFGVLCVVCGVCFYCDVVMIDCEFECVCIDFIVLCCVCDL